MSELTDKEKWLNLVQDLEKDNFDLQRQLSEAKAEIERLKDYESYSNYVHSMVQSRLTPSLFQIWQICNSGRKQ